MITNTTSFVRDITLSDCSGLGLRSPSASPSGVPATVELRQAKEKKHALVPGLSTREEKLGTRERNGIDDADRVRTNKNRELVEVRGRG